MQKKSETTQKTLELKQYAEQLARDDRAFLFKKIISDMFSMDAELFAGTFGHIFDNTLCAMELEKVSEKISLEHAYRFSDKSKSARLATMIEMLDQSICKYRYVFYPETKEDKEY